MDPDAIVGGLQTGPIVLGKVLFLLGPHPGLSAPPAGTEAVVILNPGRGSWVERLRQAGFTHAREYRLRPGLRELRWFVPASSLAGGAGMQVYTPSSWRGHVLKLAAHLSLAFRGSHLLVALREPPVLESTLARILGVQSVCLAFSTGTPGIHNKTTGLVMTDRGKVLGYAKIASESPAMACLRNEVRTLLRLEQVGALRAQVPRVIGTFAHGEAEGVVTSPGPAQPAGAAFSSVHLSFLRALQQATGRTVLFGESLMWRSIQTEYAALCGLISPEWQSRLDSAIAVLEDSLCHDVLHTALAHRDFTPWNKRRLDGDRLYAFDWEYAREEYSPWYDYFHFNLMSTLLVRRAPSVKAAARWLDGVRALGGHRTELLFLAYLVDVALSYLYARVARADSQDDSVLRYVADLFDRRSEWCGRGGLERRRPACLAPSPEP